MKCEHCNTENREGAKFCRNCGKELVFNEISIREKYPEYSLEPTSVYKIKRSSDTVAIFFVVLLGMTIMSIIDNNDLGFGFTILLAIPTAYLFYLIITSLDINLSSRFDYVEASDNKMYRFVIKDSKFGVFNIKSGKLQISCEYDYLKWKSQDKILTATIGRDVFDIDTHGNRLK